MKKQGTTMLEVLIAFVILSGAMYYAYNGNPQKDEQSAQLIASLRSIVIQSLEEAKSMGVTQLPGPGRCMSAEFNGQGTVTTAATVNLTSDSACDPQKVTVGKFRVIMTSTASPTLDPAPDFGAWSDTMKLPVLSSTFRRIDVVGAYSQSGKTGTVEISSLKRF